MGCIGCVRSEKFRLDFVARTFALVRPVFDRVSYGNQTVPNAPKWYEMNHNVSLGSNGTNCCTSSPRFPQSFVRQPNGPECTQIVRNEPKRQLRVQSGGSGAFVAKSSGATSWHELFCTSSARFAPSFVRQLNGAECTQIVQNAPKF